VPIRQLLGVIFGKVAGTYILGKEVLVSEVQPWESISVVMKDQTIDFYSPYLGRIIDLWITLSHLIYDASPKHPH
jgi:hypothetical protein